MWLTPIRLTDLVYCMTDPELDRYYLVQPPQAPSEPLLRPLTQASRLTPTRRSLTRSPGVWVPPTVSLTPDGEPLYDYTPSALRELLSEIMATLTRSPRAK